MIWAWMDTSSAETGSSQNDQARLQRERRAMPSRCCCPPENLVRVFAHRVPVQPDSIEQLLDPRRALGRRDVPKLSSGSPTDGSRAHPRVQRRVGVLNQDLHAPAEGAEPAALVIAVTSSAVEPQPARWWVRSAA